jgi:hypothetical protein
MLVDFHKIELDGTCHNQNIMRAQDYLVKYSDNWYIGRFSTQWYGLTCDIGSHSVQLGSLDEVYDFKEPRNVKPGWYCMFVEV